MDINFLNEMMFIILASSDLNPAYAVCYTLLKCTVCLSTAYDNMSTHSTL